MQTIVNSREGSASTPAPEGRAGFDAITFDADDAFRIGDGVPPHQYGLSPAGPNEHSTQVLLEEIGICTSTRRVITLEEARHYLTGRDLENLPVLPMDNLILPLDKLILDRDELVTALGWDLIEQPRTLEFEATITRLEDREETLRPVRVAISSGRRIPAAIYFLDEELAGKPSPLYLKCAPEVSTKPDGSGISITWDKVERGSAEGGYNPVESSPIELRVESDQPIACYHRYPGHWIRTNYYTGSVADPMAVRARERSVADPMAVRARERMVWKIIGDAVKADIWKVSSDMSVVRPDFSFLPTGDEDVTVKCQGILCSGAISFTGSHRARPGQSGIYGIDLNFHFPVDKAILPVLTEGLRSATLDFCMRDKDGTGKWPMNFLDRDTCQLLEGKRKFPDLETDVQGCVAVWFDKGDAHQVIPLLERAKSLVPRS